MQASLNIVTKIVAFADQQVSSDPRLKYADWLRNVSGIEVSDPRTEAHQIPALGSATIFDGVRSTSIGVSTAFDLSLSTLDPSRYRITWSAGTNPTLRTGRSLTLSGVLVTTTVLSNATLQVAVPVGPDFTAVNVGDEVFIPHTTTGDSANVLSVINAGYWSVLAKPDSQTLILQRQAGMDFEGIGEAVTLTSNDQFRAYSSAGVQIGDGVDINAGFAVTTRRTYEVVAVTDAFFEIISTKALAAESGITPGASGMIFYTEAKRFLYIEADQDCVIRLNGSTDNTQRVEAVEPGNPDSPGPYMKWGPVWSLVVVNMSTSPVNLNVIHAG